MRLPASDPVVPTVAPAPVASVPVVEVSPADDHLVVSCNTCGKQYRSARKNIGRTIACKCGGAVLVSESLDDVQVEAIGEVQVAALNAAPDPLAIPMSPQFPAAQSQPLGLAPQYGNLNQSRAAQVENSRKKKYRAAQRSHANAQQDHAGEFDYGILGGVGMMIGAVVWFVVGWQGGVIFFYPPVLFCIGCATCFRGMFSG